MSDNEYWNKPPAQHGSKSSYWRGSFTAPAAQTVGSHDEASRPFRDGAAQGVPASETPQEDPAQNQPVGGAADQWAAANREANWQASSGSVSARARQAYAAEALRQKDHVSAGLLAIFLGVFGIHKFYLGCNQSGFIMLAVSIIGGVLTLGLAAAVIEVISIIEGVIYLTKTQTEFDQIYVLHQRDWF